MSQEKTHWKNREEFYSYFSRAQPDWAYEFPDRTGPDTQICRTGPARPDWIQTYIFKNLTKQNKKYEKKIEKNKK